MMNQLRDKVFQIACEHGWHEKEVSDDHCLMLVITALSKAVEADRKDRHLSDEDKQEYLKCQKEKFYNAFEDYIKGTVDEKMADAYIRLLDLAGMRGIDIDSRILKVREDYKEITSIINRTNDTSEKARCLYQLL